MIVVTLRTPKGEPACDIQLPANASELPLARYVSFINEAAKMSLPGNNIVMTMARAVAEFSGQDLDKILTAHFGNEWQQNDSSIDGIRAMYGWCLDAVGKYKGVLRNKSTHQFTHKKTTFEIPTLILKAINGTILPDIETGEAIEAFEVVRTFGDQIERSATVQECVAFIRAQDSEQDKYVKRLRILVPELSSVELIGATDEQYMDILQKHGDDDGNLAFSRYLYMMAILCRKPGEKLPVKHTEKKAFINSRAAFFEDIDTATALDVDFFLLSTLKSLKKNQQTVGSLILPAFGAVAETKSLNVKRIIDKSSTRKPFTSVLGGARLRRR